MGKEKEQQSVSEFTEKYMDENGKSVAMSVVTADVSAALSKAIELRFTEALTVLSKQSGILMAGEKLAEIAGFIAEKDVYKATAGELLEQAKLAANAEIKTSLEKAASEMLAKSKVAEAVLESTPSFKNILKSAVVGSYFTAALTTYSVYTGYKEGKSVEELQRIVAKDVISVGASLFAELLTLSKSYVASGHANMAKFLGRAGPQAMALTVAFEFGYAVGTYLNENIPFFTDGIFLDGIDKILESIGKDSYSQGLLVSVKSQLANLLATLASNDLTDEQIKRILKANEVEGDEFSAVKTILQQINDIFGLGLANISDNDKLPENIHKAIKETDTYHNRDDKAGSLVILPLTEGSGINLTSVLRNDIQGYAYRYALLQLNSFVLYGDGIDYLKFNQNGELDLYDPATGRGTLTETYLLDRIAYFNHLSNIWKTGQGYSDENHALTTTVYDNLDGPDVVQYPANGDWGQQPLDYKVIFGTDSEEGDTIDATPGWLTRDPKAGVRIYAGDGNDTIIVGEGNNYLEGGAGYDRYIITGKGTHVISDIDATGYLYFGDDDGTIGRIEQSTDSPIVWDSVDETTREPDGRYTLIRRGNDLQVTSHEMGAEVIIKNFFLQFPSSETGVVIGYGIILPNCYPGSPSLPEQTTPGSNVIMGDLAPKDTNDQLAGIQVGYDQYGNLIGQGSQPDRVDTLYDTPNNDAIYGKGGDDRIYGGRGGNDYLDGGAGDDYIKAGSGNDTLIGGTGNDMLYGGAGNDYLDGGDNVDKLYGEDGDDVLRGGKGNDELTGGKGKDTFMFAVGDGVDTITDGEDGDVVWFEGMASNQLTAILRVGSDLVLRYGSNDQVTVEDYFSNLSKSPQIIFKFTDAVWSVADIKARAVMYGSDESEPLSGYAEGTNRIYGLGGNDSIYGNEFDDLLDGGDGDDQLSGGSGNDLLIGGQGNDYLWGGDDRDILIGGQGDDYLNGGKGGDIYRISRGDGQDTIEDDDSTPGEIDTVEFVDLRLSDITAVLRMNDGWDLVLQYGNGDQLTIKNYFLGYINGVDHDGDGKTDDHKIERFVFSDGSVWTEYDIRERMVAIFDDADNYQFAYGDQDNRMYGMGGNDVLHGGAGNDLLDGGSDDDTLFAGFGDDTLIGGTGNDELYGEGGSDTYIFSKGDGIDFILDTGVSTVQNDSGQYERIYDNDVIRFTDVASTEVVLLRKENDLIIRYGVDDELTIKSYFSFEILGNVFNPAAFPITRTIEFSDGVVWMPADVVDHVLPDGIETILGTSEDDNPWGFAPQKDKANQMYGLDGDDAFHGHMFNDVLDGGAGNDTLHGEGGADRLIGNLGDDVLYGGTGNDTYVFRQGDGHDVIDSSHSGSRTIGHDTVEFVNVGSDQIDSVTRNGSDLIIWYGNDSLTIQGYFDEIQSVDGIYYADEVKQFKFSDGLIWTREDVLAQLEPGTEEPEPGDSIIWGTPGDDVLTGGVGNQTIYGGAGNDTLTSITGWDRLFGQDGDDTLYGGDSFTILNGGAGNDVLYGGSGDDQFEFDLEDLTEETTDQIINASSSDYVRVGNLWLDELVYQSTGNGQWQSEDGVIQLQLNGSELIIRYCGEDGVLLPGTIIVKDYSEGILALPLPDYPSGGGAVVNQSPVAGSSLSDQTVMQNGLFSLVLSEDLFSDPDGDTLAYSVTLADGSPLPDWLTFDAETRTLSGVPGNGEVGSLSFKITATDPEGLSASQTFGLSVTNVNDAPEAVGTLSNQNATQDRMWSYVIPDTAFSDIDGDTLIYSVTLADGSALPSWLTFDASTRTLSGTPANGDVGSLSLKVIVNDPDGLSASQTFSLAIANVNDAPEAGTVLGDQMATKGQAFNLLLPESLFSDPDGDSLTFSVTLADGSSLPSWLTFDADTRSLSGMPANGDVGSLSLKVTAIDPDGLSASQTFGLAIVSANDAPEAGTTLSDQAATQGQVFNLLLPESLFSDSDGDTLTFSVTLADGSALPSWLTFNAVTRTLSGTPANGDVGSLSLRVTATDPGGLSASQTFGLAVTNVNDAPEAVGTLDGLQANSGQAWQYIIPESAFRDIDGDALVYSVTLADGSVLPSWLTFNVATRTLSGTPAAGDIGELALRIVATDPGGLYAFQRVTVNVQAPERVYNNVNGTSGQDRLTGTAGDDCIDGKTGNDTIYGKGGANKYVFRVGDGQDTVVAGERGRDTIQFMDIRSDEIRSFRRVGNDLVIDYGVSDSITVKYHFEGGSGSMGLGTLIGTLQFTDKTVNAEQFIAAYGVHLTDNADNLSFGSQDDLVYAGDGNDTVKGGNGNDSLYGEAGDDLLYGENGDDWLYGGAGNDRLYGGEGDDVLIGSAGNDSLYGGKGANIYRFQKGDGQDTVVAGETGKDTIHLVDVNSNELRGIRRSGNDLIIDYGVSDSITVKNHYAPAYYAALDLGTQVGKLQFADQTFDLDTYVAGFTVGANQTPRLTAQIGTMQLTSASAQTDQQTQMMQTVVPFSSVQQTETISEQTNRPVLSVTALTPAKLEQRAVICHQAELLIQSMAAFSPSTAGQTVVQAEWQRSRIEFVSSSIV